MKNVSHLLANRVHSDARLHNRDGANTAHLNILVGVVLVLADELSPDTCRLWDTVTGERMDKDRFRRDLGRVRETYEEVAERLHNALK